ncbi:MAG: hypothetical protein MUO88_17675, partial [Desulfobacterales bacterium]|nr:hypothetical protein [Desulfobacterales bacterium]
NYKVAETYFQKIISQIPSDRNSYLQSSLQCLGYIYIEKKEHKHAIIEFKKALKIKSDSSIMRAEIYCGMAQAYFGLNKTWKTIKFGLKALDEQFDDATAERVYFLLAYSYSLKKDKENERYYTEKLRGVKPDSAYLRELDRF